MLRFLFILNTLFCLCFVSCMYVEKPGPRYPPTKGAVWPKPQHENKELNYMTYGSNFRTTVKSHSCTILTNAIHRYSDAVSRLYQLASTHRRRSGNMPDDCTPTPGVPSCSEQEGSTGTYAGEIKELQIQLTQPCEEYPYLEMDEKYSLKVGNVSRLKSDSIWGILRGLETFSQLFYLSDDGNEVRVNATDIVDYPRYAHRGLLLDTSRHYISISNILLTLDAMAMNKMNVFHWHIVDDQSFPYESEKFPLLSKLGAFHPTMIYKKEDIQLVINYATARGIRVIPEFDVPGHTRSWGVAYPNVLSECYVNNEMIGLGPMDPTNNATYNLIRDLFQEVQRWFPDTHLHVGGDEVELDCWLSNPRIVEYMMRHNISSGKQLHALFMANAIPLLNPTTVPVVWQEVFDNNVPLPQDALVQVWKGGEVYEINKLLSEGKRVLFSSAWYLDYLDKNWQDYYKADPRSMVENQTLANNIVGGEACMWGEMIDDRNFMSRMWPRASAVAEVLWSPKMPSMNSRWYTYTSVIIPSQVYNRIEEHTCRMIQRGISAQPPSGPGFCVAS